MSAEGDDNESLEPPTPDERTAYIRRYGSGKDLITKFPKNWELPRKVLKHQLGLRYIANHGRNTQLRAKLESAVKNEGRITAPTAAQTPRADTPSASTPRASTSSRIPSAPAGGPPGTAMATTGGGGILGRLTIDQQQAAAAAVYQQKQKEPLKFKGLLAKDLAPMMYGFGDDMNPDPESVTLLEEITVKYIIEMTQQVQALANQRSVKCLRTQDLLYLVRKDPQKFLRGKELMELLEELKTIEKSNLDLRKLDERPKRDFKRQRMR